MKIRSMMVACALALATAAVPGTALAASAPAQAVHQTHAQSVQTPAQPTIALDGQRALSARGPAPIGGFNGNLAWTNSSLHLWGVLWGDGSGIVTCVELNWDAAGVNWNREPDCYAGSGGVNYYTNTPEPSYAVVSVCAYGYSGNWECGPAA